MNVVLIAWCPSSAVYVDAFRDADARVTLSLVVTGASRQYARPIAARCEARGVPIVACDDLVAPEVLARIGAAAPDLVVVAGWPRVIRAPVRALARVGVVNVHPSLLPRRRGREPLFWALVRGDAAVGVTFHHLTEDLDAGPILLQRAIAVPARATSLSLAAEVAAAGSALVPELVAMAKAGALPAGDPQDEDVATHDPPIRAEHGLLDWAASADALDRLVRACAGEIEAYTFFRGTRVVVLEARPIGIGARGAVGEVLACDDRGVVVGTGEGALGLERFRFLRREWGARELAGALGMAFGGRLSANPAL